MSKTKKYLEDVSVEAGFDGEINDEVIARAKEKIALEHFPEFSVRTSGLVEIICKHGVGHPSIKLTQFRNRNDHQINTIHGCDGCCSNSLFVVAEDYYRKMKLC